MVVNCRLVKKSRTYKSGLLVERGQSGNEPIRSMALRMFLANIVGSERVNVFVIYITHTCLGTSTCSSVNNFRIKILD